MAWFITMSDVFDITHFIYCHYKNMISAGLNPHLQPPLEAEMCITAHNTKYLAEQHTDNFIFLQSCCWNSWPQNGVKQVVAYQIQRHFSSGSMKVFSNFLVSVLIIGLNCGIITVRRIYPLEIINIHSKIHGNLSTVFSISCVQLWHFHSVLKSSQCPKWKGYIYLAK